MQVQVQAGRRCRSAGAVQEVCTCMRRWVAGGLDKQGGGMGTTSNDSSDFPTTVSQYTVHSTSVLRRVGEKVVGS